MVVRRWFLEKRNLSGLRASLEKILPRCSLRMSFLKSVVICEAIMMMTEFRALIGKSSTRMVWPF